MEPLVEARLDFGEGLDLVDEDRAEPRASAGLGLAPVILEVEEGDWSAVLPRERSE